MTYDVKNAINVFAASLIVNGVNTVKVKEAIVDVVNDATEQAIHRAAQRLRDKATQTIDDLFANVEQDVRSNQPPVYVDDIKLDSSFNARANAYADRVASEIVVDPFDLRNAEIDLPRKYQGRTV